MPTIELLKAKLPTNEVAEFIKARSNISKAYNIVVTQETLETSSSIETIVDSGAGIAADAPTTPKKAAPTTPSRYKTPPSTPSAPHLGRYKKLNEAADPNDPRTPTKAVAAALPPLDSRIGDGKDLRKYQAAKLEERIENKQDLILYVLNALQTAHMGTAVDSVQKIVSLIETGSSTSPIGSIKELLIALSAIQQAVIADELLAKPFTIAIHPRIQAMQTIKSYNLENLIFDICLIVLAKQPDLLNGANDKLRGVRLLKTLSTYDFDTSVYNTYKHKRELYNLVHSSDITSLHTPPRQSFWTTPRHQATGPTSTAAPAPAGARTGTVKRQLWNSAPTGVHDAPEFIIENPKLTPYIKAAYLTDNQKKAVQMMVEALVAVVDVAERTKIETATTTLLEDYKAATTAYNAVDSTYGWETAFVPKVEKYKNELSTHLSGKEKVGIAACCVAGALLGGAIGLVVGVALTASFMGADGGFSAVMATIMGADMGVKAGILLFSALCAAFTGGLAGRASPGHIRGEHRQAAHTLAKSLAPRPPALPVPAAVPS